MLLIDRVSPEEQALDAWREAADLVRVRWATFIEADAQTRQWAFASYVAALDAEEAASLALWAHSTRRAA
jgi:antibiotic biosynthesis monooxygenase (ABM) superfamily enzyme